MSRRLVRPALLLAVTATAATALATPVIAAPMDRITAMMARMSLAEKVGQMFVSYVYGTSAHHRERRRRRRTTSALYGDAVDNGAQTGGQVPPGRRHLLRLGEQADRPAADRRAVQRSAAAASAGTGPVADQHRPGGRHRQPDRRARRGVARATWRSARRSTPRQAYRAGVGVRHRAARHGHQHGRRAGRGRQHQPAEQRRRPPLVRRPDRARCRAGRGRRRRLPARRGRRAGQALPRPRRHDRQHRQRRRGHRTRRAQQIMAIDVPAVPRRHRGRHRSRSWRRTSWRPPSTRPGCRPACPSRSSPGCCATRCTTTVW